MPGKVGIVATISGVRASKNRKKASKKKVKMPNMTQNQKEKRCKNYPSFLIFFFSYGTYIYIYIDTR